ncbi:MAG: hypothetical protein WCT28_01680 [Patescibacteria group bacterium]|jgi:hypothetical protein
MIRFRLAFFLIVLVMVTHIFVLVAGVYSQMPWFDVPMHFFGGYVIALLGLACYGWLQNFVEIKSKSMQKLSIFTPMIIEFVFVVGFVMTVGVAWEWYEFLFDQFVGFFVENFGVAQISLADTMDDLFNDFVGGVTAWMLWRSRK